jgi:hypothetical protein
MDLKVGDTYKCPEGHKAKIVWTNADKTVIGVKCPRQHLSKVVSGKEIYQKNWVFLIEVS